MTLTSFNDFLLKVAQFQSKIRKLPESFAIEPRRTLKIVLVGGVGVGKRGLMRRLFEVDVGSIVADGYLEKVIVRGNAQSTQDVQLELVKVPGLTSMARPDQSEDYPVITSDLFNLQTTSADLVILCEPADRDIVNSESLRRIKDAQIDEKVILVVSKLDLLEEGTGVDEAILKEVAGSFAAIVAVRNAANLESGDPVDLTNQKEQSFFSTYSTGLSWGIHCLRSQILKALDRTFERERTQLCSRLWRERVRLEERLVRFKDPNFKSKLVTEYIDTLTREISNDSVDGSCAMRIGMIFWKCLPEALDDIDPLKGIDMQHLNILIKNSQGLRSSFQLENAFKILVKSQLKQCEAVVFDCLQLVARELKRVLIVPVVEAGGGDCVVCEEDEFFDVKSLSDLEDEEEREEGGGGEYINDDVDFTHGTHDTLSIAIAINSSLTSIHDQLKLIPGLVSSLNTRTSNLLSLYLSRTHEYLKDYCGMEGELIYCGDVEFTEAVEEYYRGGIDINCGSIASLVSNTMLRNSTSTSTSSINSSDDSVPLQSIQESNSKEAEINNSFLKEFLALLFPPPLPLTKRVEYRPRHRARQSVRQSASASVNASVRIVDDTTNDIDIVTTAANKESEFLLKLLKIYLKSHHRHLSSFLPKCINYHLISNLLKSLPSLIYDLDTCGSDRGEVRMRVRGIERVLNIIEEINIM